MVSYYNAVASIFFGGDGSTDARSIIKEKEIGNTLCFGGKRHGHVQ